MRITFWRRGFSASLFRCRTAMPPRVPEETRIKIIGLSESGFSQRQISLQMKCSLTAVNRIIKAFREEGRIKDAPRGAPPASTSREEDNLIAAASAADPFLAATDIKRELNLQASAVTIRRRLLSCGLKSSVSAEKIGLSDEHKVKRVLFAQEHKQWTVNQWAGVIFSDESTFSSCFNQRRRVWRPSQHR